MAEIWKPVLEWEGFYEVSNLGRVRSLSNWVKAGRGNMKRAGRILSNFNRQGRLFVNLNYGGYRTTVTVHRLVLESFVGLRPEGLECKHLNGNAANNHISNLVWGTKLENEADKVAHGTASRPPLNIEEINDIRASPKKQQELADQYGVSQSLISRIKSGERRSVGVS